MPDRPIQASSQVVPAAPVRGAADVARVAPAGGPAPRVAADGLDLARKAPAIEADVRVAMRGGANVDAEGTVKVRKGFVINLVKDVLRDPRAFSRIEVAFDPQARAYEARGVVKWHGIPVPIAMAAVPTVVDGKLAVRFENPRLRLGFMDLKLGLMTGIAQDLVLEHLRSTRIVAEAGADRATIKMEATSLLHEIGVMPGWIRLDTARTKLAMAVNAAGDITVDLKSPTAPAAGALTPRSDVVVAVDDAALQAVMARAMEGEYDLKSLKLRKDGMAITGMADYKPISDTLTVAKGLLILMAVAGGNGRTPAGMNTDPTVTVKGPLDLDARVTADALYLKPSIGQACGEMMKLLERAGIPATREGGTIKVGLAAAAEAVGAELRRLRIDEHGVELHAGLDVERLIRNPRLLAAN